MDEGKFFERTKSDYNDLQSYLIKNELVDERGLWFAGFDNYRKATNNAIAGNLLYGNKRLIIVSVKGNEIFYLNNSKKGFRLKVIGGVDEKNKVSSSMHLIHPVVDITTKEGEYYSIKVTKNKKCVKEFKKAIK